MITRVTTQMSMAAAQTRLQAGAAKLAQLQEQASTLKNIGRPSDDPVGTGQSMSVRKEQAENAQYTRNAQDAGGWLDTTDSALGHVYTLLNNVRDLTVQAANDGTAGDADRKAYVTSLQALKSDLLAAANTTYGSRSVFAGSSDATTAYDPTGAWVGDTNPGTAVQRRIGDAQTVRVDTPGSAVFGTGAASVFSMIDGLVADIQSGTNVNPKLADIDAAITTVRGAQADVGVRQASVDATAGTLKSASTSLEAKRSGIEDKDLAKAVLDLQLQQTNYQAALAVTAKVLQPTLMDYLS